MLNLQTGCMNSSQITIDVNGAKFAFDPRDWKNIRSYLNQLKVPRYILDAIEKIANKNLR